MSQRSTLVFISGTVFGIFISYLYRTIGDKITITSSLRKEPSPPAIVEGTDNDEGEDENQDDEVPVDKRWTLTFKVERKKKTDDKKN